MPIPSNLDAILTLISPEALRQRIQLPLDEAREAFMPQFLATTSFDNLLDELGRFIAHVKQRWLSLPSDWPHDAAKAEARQLLDATGGALAAMQACRHGDHGGLRAILDAITRELQAQALAHYLDTCVLPRIEHLSLDESLELADAYLAQFSVIPDLALEQPTAIVGRWKHIVYQHARLVLGIPSPRASDGLVLVDEDSASL